jgi:CHAT domain-containing protein
VHVATHGQFDSDHTRSFLLTYDEKLTMDELRETIGARQFSDEPVELLVLSACETAAGDDRAALGLAGVALQAGARTAVATLWFINDESTADMVSEFYRQLDSSDLSKAEALRAAQLSLLEQPRYRHPSYWAPFLLIGNWL